MPIIPKTGAERAVDSIRRTPRACRNSALSISARQTDSIVPASKPSMAIRIACFRNSSFKPATGRSRASRPSRRATSANATSRTTDSSGGRERITKAFCATRKNDRKPVAGNDISVVSTAPPTTIAIEAGLTNAHTSQLVPLTMTQPSRASVANSPIAVARSIIARPLFPRETPDRRTPQGGSGRTGYRTAIETFQ